MCTCNAQLQPHDPLPGACTPREVHDRELDETRQSYLDRLLASEQDGDRPFDAWVDLGGEA